MNRPVLSVDPRVLRTHEGVVAATVALLVECGFERITIEAIAERSGVARSTIYRNWDTRADLLVAAFEQMCAFREIPDLGSLDAELRIVAEDLANGLTREQWGVILPSLVGASFCDPELAEAQRRFADHRRVMVAEVFTRAITRGEIDGRHEPGHLAEQFAAGFFFRHLMAQRPIDGPFIDRQLAMLAQLTAG